MILPPFQAYLNDITVQEDKNGFYSFRIHVQNLIISVKSLKDQAMKEKKTRV